MPPSGSKAIHCKGLDETLNRFLMYKEFPLFMVVDNSTPIFSYKGGDSQEGYKEFESNMIAMQQSGTTAVMCVKFFSDTGKGGTLIQQNCEGSFNFRLTEPMENSVVKLGSASSPATIQNNQFTDYILHEKQALEAKYEALQEKLEEQKEYIKELEKELAEVESKQPDQDLGLIGSIGKAGEAFPWMQETIRDFFTIMRHKVAAPARNENSRPAAPVQARPQQQQQYGGIAGVPPEQRVNEAIKGLLTGYYIPYIGKGEAAQTDQEKQASEFAGFTAFAEDMELMHILSNDRDVMDLARKKLKQMQ